MAKRKSIKDRTGELRISAQDIAETSGFTRQTIYRYMIAFDEKGESGNEKIDAFFNYITAHDDIDIVNAKKSLHVYCGAGARGKQRDNKEVVKFFSYVHGSYENASYLVPGDLMLNGEIVEDRTHMHNVEQIIDTNCRLESYSYILGRAKDITRRFVDDKGAWYSDSQKTFVEVVSPIGASGSYMDDYRKARSILEIFSEIMKDEIMSCKLKAVEEMREKLNESIRALNTLEYYSVPDNYDSIETIRQKINDNQIPLLGNKPHNRK